MAEKFRSLKTFCIEVIGSIVGGSVASLILSTFTKDPWFLHAMGNRLGIDLKIPAVSRKVNESMPEYSVCLIDRYFQNLSKKSEEISIGVLGLSFKNNTSDCRFTPTKPAIEKLLSLGYTVRIYDPLLTQEDAFSLT